MATQTTTEQFPTNSFKVKMELIQKTSYYSKWQAFASNTTLHGLRHVFDKSYSIAKRVIWLLFLWSSSATFLFLLSVSVNKFKSKPMKTVVSQATPAAGLKFAALTICNLNKFMKSKIDVADEDENFANMGLNISGCREIRWCIRGNLTCGQALLCAYVWYGTYLYGLYRFK